MIRNAIKYHMIRGGLIIPWPDLLMLMTGFFKVSIKRVFLLHHRPPSLDVGRRSLTLGGIDRTLFFIILCINVIHIIILARSDSKFSTKLTLLKKTREIYFFFSENPYNILLTFRSFFFLPVCKLFRKTIFVNRFVDHPLFHYLYYVNLPFC